MKASDLQDRIIARLLRDHGGTKRHWRAVVGRVKLYDPATHPHCNWSIDPQSSTPENAVIEAMLDDLRLRVRIVTPG